MQCNLSYSNSYKYYRKYLKDPKYEFPTNNYSRYAQEDVKRLINYIEGDKMSVYSAARRIKMSRLTAQKYFKEYQNDPKHKVPVSEAIGSVKNSSRFEKCTQIVFDIYKSNSSITPLN